MGYVFDQPAFPVVESDPGFWQTVQYFRTSDWQILGAASAGTMILGYYAGRPQYMHRPTMVVGGIMGAVFGFCHAYQSTSARLYGFRENAEEVAASKK